MAEWKEYKIDDLADIHNNRRIPLSTMQRQSKRGIYPYYGASGIIDYIDEYIFDGNFVLISEDGENLNSRQTPIAFEAKGKFWVNNHAHIIKAKDEYLNKLLVYYFSNLDLSPFITGAVQPKLSKESLLRIPIILPLNNADKQKIVETLTCLDDKIDLLHRQNKTLETMAEALFRQWFVEEAQEDWEEVKLGEVADFYNGKSRPKETLNGEIPIYGGNGILGYTDQHNYDGRLIIIGRVGAYCGSLYLENNKVWVSDNALVTMPKKEGHTYYLYYLLKTLELNSMAEGSSHPLLTQGLLKSIEIIKPKDSRILEYEQFVDGLQNKIETNQSQIRTLTQLRDTLLPKLMSGEVRVRME